MEVLGAVLGLLGSRVVAVFGGVVGVVPGWFGGVVTVAGTRLACGAGGGRWCLSGFGVLVRGGAEGLSCRG
ncbi:hypothetical protein GCM10010508_69580 [Streptomyces naganishii JCM 4654]|uniref:Uncharacterized protein n=1 Tax=Streptomyces naganishii JCM 4654 TaxID=1306179 RepID=A0A919CYT7_9ACTN|nr:hypothetical protein GCM10010508_69580 [Streptomyces naganishii JCM 4654]